MEKQFKAEDASCISCGASMKYSPERKKLFCAKCNSVKDIDFVSLTEKRNWEDRDKATISTKNWESLTKSLKCPNCGAGVVLNKLEYTKTCPYCNSGLIASENETNSFSPDGIIPFKFSKQEASNKFTEGVKKKFFVPRAFKKVIPVENIKGIYIPAFSFDADSSSKYSGKLAIDETYTRNGKRYATTSYRNISGTHSQKLVDIVVESSSKLNQKQMSEILPYNMTNLVKFDQAFIMGYTVEQYENAVDICKTISKRIMEDNIKKAILSKYRYDRVITFSLDAEFSNEKYIYNLLPVYSCNFTYKSKNYNTFMNGDTGKVGGGFPISKLKVTFVVILLFLVFVGLPILIYILNIFE